MITVVFEDGVNDYFARQLVFERMQSVRDESASGKRMSSLGPITTGLGEVFQYTLVSKDKKHDATELRTMQDYIVRPILRTVPGVADVSSFGGRVKQFQVIVNPDRLTSFKISLQQVFEALQKNNANANGNFIEHKSEQYIVQGLGLVKDTNDIENIIVATHEHTPIFVRDVAEVKIGCGIATRRGHRGRQRRSGLRHRADAERREWSRRGQRDQRKAARHREGAARLMSILFRSTTAPTWSRPRSTP